MKLTIVDVGGGAAAPGHPGRCEVVGEVATGPLLEGADLRHAVVHLAPGGALRWPPGHGEEALYVLAGDAVVEGRTLPTGAAIILHRGGELRLDAPGGARLAHFWTAAGADDPFAASAPAARDPARAATHLVEPDGWARSGRPGASMATWFADSTCPGCDVTLMRVERDTPGNRGRAHTHSADEVIAVIEGSISFGAHELPTGTAVHVPADTRYAVTCGPSRHAFLNYRAGPSTQRYEGDPAPVPETALGRGGHLVAP